ncbi:putative porin [Parahaliea mediterranea]|uniref:putative porin n=1 Tax=Parahaliea mediterranea TaxID=651086 RepID=UPI000E2EB063|nr:putative porin [Parahaliea mediterranea]
MKSAVLPPVAALCCVLSPLVSATVSDADFAQMREQMSALMSRVAVLEQENARLQDLVDDEAAAPTLGAAPAPKKLSWNERIAISGNFRYRYEEIDVEELATRDRNRIRARLGIRAQLPGNVEVGTEIATGGDNPLSANQTLGGGASRKDIGLNLAYVRWQPLEGSYLSAGKMTNPFYRPADTALLWDDDYNPEGIGAGWSNGTAFVHGLVSWLESDSVTDNQRVTWGLQGGLSLHLGDARLTTGLGYFDIPVAGQSPFFGGPDVFFGNSFTCAEPGVRDDCSYRYDYQEMEWFAALDFTAFSLPAVLYADAVQNLAVDEFEHGWLAGGRLGEAGKRGTWELGYQYQELEADAALGLVTDSNFAAGGTDGRGHKLYGMYALENGIKLGLTWFINNEFGADNQPRALTYDRVILDARFKY